MTMTAIWTGMVAISILCGLATGRGPAVAAAAAEGASAAVELALSIAGMLCLWTGVMEVMRRSGLADGLSRLLAPVLRRLFPQAAKQFRQSIIRFGTINTVLLIIYAEKLGCQLRLLCIHPCKCLE